MRDKFGKLYDKFPKSSPAEFKQKVEDLYEVRKCEILPEMSAIVCDANEKMPEMWVRIVLIIFEYTKALEN